MQGRLTGLRKDGEKITLKLVPLKDLWKEGARDGKTLAAWALYEGLKKEGKI
jgi:ADP-sugar diphosphatase